MPTQGSGSFNLHLGSTDCMGDFADGGVKSCGRPNVAEVTLTGFDPMKSKVVVDYAQLIEGDDLSTGQGGAPGCMSGSMDPECAPIFQRLGIDIKDGSIHPETQKLFHVE